MALKWLLIYICFYVSFNLFIYIIYVYNYCKINHIIATDGIMLLKQSSGKKLSYKNFDAICSMETFVNECQVKF